MFVFIDILFYGIKQVLSYPDLIKKITLFIDIFELRAS